MLLKQRLMIREQEESWGLDSLMGGRGRVKTNCHHVELHRESMGQSHNGQSSDHQHTSAFI